MFFSPFKRRNKKKKKKRNVFEIAPPSSKMELREALLQTYSSKAKIPSKLPIRIWMNNYKNLQENWMRELLQETDSAPVLLSPLCLIYCFFIGRTDNVFESSVGRSGQREYCKTKFLQFLNQQFQQHFAACTRLVDDEKRKKFCITDKMVAKLLSSVEECFYFVWSMDAVCCPLEVFLSEQNSISGPGWLRILLYYHEGSVMKPDRHRCNLIVILHTIICGFCGSGGGELCTALGKKVSKKRNNLQWLRLIAKDLVWDVFSPSPRSERESKKESPGLKSSGTAPTASASDDLSTSVQGSLRSPSIVPVSVSFADQKEDNRTSPLTVDDLLTSSADTQLVDTVLGMDTLQSTPPSNSNESFETASPPNLRMQQTPSSRQSTPETPQTQVQKRFCLAPTPVLSPVLRRTLFIPAANRQKTPKQTSNLISSGISQECRHFMHAISTSQNDEEIERRALEFVSLRADHSGTLLHKRIYQLPSRPVAATTSGRSRQRYVRDAAKSAVDFIRSTISGAASDKELQKNVLTKAIESNFDLTVCKKPEAPISSLEVLEVRNRSGWNISTSVTTSIIKDVLTLLKKKNMLVSDKNVFEGQLRKKIGLLERVSAVPSKFEYVECYVTKEDVERCVYYYIENVPLLIERLVSSCIIEGEMEDSLAFSTYKNKVIFRFGADRGGGDLIMMIALANRRKGNHGRFSIPIGVVEGATETYSNLVKTVYSSTRKAILEQLVNQQLFMIRIQFFSEDDTSAAPQDEKCILLRFVGAKREDLSLMKIVCTIGGIEYVGIPHTQMTQWKSRAHGRIVADDASINEDQLFLTDNGKRELRVNLQLLELEDHYIGCRVQIATTMEEIFSFKFDNGVNTKDIDLNNSMVDCLQVIGVPCEDGKMCTTVYGLSTCGASFPCPKCHWPLREGVASTWVGDHATAEDSSSDALAVPTKDYRERTGKYSRNESYYHFTARTGEMTSDPALRLKKEVFSVIYKPLLHIEDDFLYLHTGDPMHVSQGLMTHLTEETAIQLQKATELGLESQPDFIKDQTTKVKAFIEVMASRSSSFAFKHAQNRYKQEDGLVKSAFKELRAADDDAVDECYEAYTCAVMNRDEIGQELGYHETCRKLNGADELRSLLQNLERSKKKNFTKTVYLFMKAIKTFAGDFNKNHGQYELTNARGIKTLEINEEVYNIVIKGCDDPAVLEIMNWWRASAKLLLQISSALKSQDKQGIDDILKLKESVANFVQLWVNRLVLYERKNPIYWKMHMLLLLLCALVPFIEKTGMSGRCSTEGFENKHHVMNQLKKLMAPIAQDKLRCEKLSQRQQSCLIPGIEEVHCIFEEEDYKTRMGPRGRYSSFGTRTKLLEDIPVEETVGGADEEEVEAVAAGYFVSQKNNLIPNELKDIYYYMLLGKVPDAWSQNFIESTLLGSKASNSARYIPP